MKVTDPGIIVGSSGLLSVEEIDNSVKITLKNKTTLDIAPVISEDGKFEGFTYNYMTAQQNRKIKALQEKMKKLSMEMQGIIDTDSETDEDDEDLEDDDIVEEDEELEE